jgi:protein-S-isoprenylcysteine O-methyltransferase Ste14
MDIAGRLPINPFLFFTGKVAIIFSSIAFIIHIAGFTLPHSSVPPLMTYAAGAIFVIGVMVFIAGMLDLGSSLMVGLPRHKAGLKTRGIYAITRNPIYMGLYTMSVASFLSTLNLVILAAGIYGIYVHHLIIHSEERYLKSAHGKEYGNYCGKVKRYF